MKKTLEKLCICVLVLLTGCAGEPVPSLSTEQTEAAIYAIPAEIPDEAGHKATEPTDQPMNEPVEVFRAPENILVFPYERRDLQQARDAAARAVETLSAETGVLTFHTDCLEFDPILTDIKVRQHMAHEQVPGWTEEEYYRHHISFTLKYSAEYDHTRTFQSNADHETMGIHLVRQDAADEWSLGDMGNPVSDYSGYLTEPGTLQALSEEGRCILAAYGPIDGQYWVYEENAGAVNLKKYESAELSLPAETGTPPPKLIQPGPAEHPVLRESVCQMGEPISPQPGDTAAMWNPESAEAFPADPDCTSMEFFEKWMGAEGLTLYDLEKRSCTQLVVVSAQEGDGAKTMTTCYQKEAGGRWEPVEGLTRMQGHTGSNGVAHTRLRNTNTSPAGLWKLGTGFGNANRPEHLKIPWRQITPQSDWVCDAESVYFNTWQERDDPGLLEGWNYEDVEHLENYPSAYAYACVIEFNMPPYTIPDRGCAIFLHCSRGPTGGCIGLSQENMVKVLKWLDGDQNPYILISGHEKTD